MTTVFDGLDRAGLAVLVREYLLCGHLIDRAAMPFVFATLGMEGMRDVAINEWMGASPVYTRRMRRALDFEGDDVETIFKGMQLDIGAPPQFMDFRYRVIDAKHGEFELAHCGALMDVEPTGQPFVVTMCHHIEDPTFDATAAATNPRARMRPVHRPPRAPAGRLPHCLWNVTIDDDAEPLHEPEIAQRVATSRAATLDISSEGDETGEGRTDYRGPLENDLPFESFSKPTLIWLLREIALQGHLLTLSFTDSLQGRVDGSKAREIAVQRFTGIAGVAAQRLKHALGLGSDLAGLVKVLELHPAFHPREYIDVSVSPDLEISLHDCTGIGDRPGLSWAELLASGETAPLDAIVQAVDPRARCIPRDPDGALRTWGVEISSDPAAEKPEVSVTKISTGAAFSFESR
ncbi:MAG TPA: hypothetical protein VKV69_11395 [Actinomycetota bacterium]|nr:hypothetical protein [Actinomycetota bacterium]